MKSTSSRLDKESQRWLPKALRIKSKRPLHSLKVLPLPAPAHLPDLTFQTAPPSPHLTLLPTVIFGTCHHRAFSHAIPPHLECPALVLVILHVTFHRVLPPNLLPISYLFS